MNDIIALTPDQRSFLKSLVSDFGGPTSTGTVLYILRNVLDELKPDWKESLHTLGDEQLIADLEVCAAALAYLDIKTTIED